MVRGHDCCDARPRLDYRFFSHSTSRSSKSVQAHIPATQENSSLKSSGLCLQRLKSCGFSGACYNLLPPLYRKGASLANLNLVSFTAENEANLQALRTRLHKMTDQQLLRFGQTARYMCSSGANLGEPPREIFVVQLREVRTEWQRRNPEVPPSASLGGTEGRPSGSKA